MCPHFQGSDIPENFSEINIPQRTQIKIWFSNFLKFKFFYNEELELLGISGVPFCLRYLFDGTVHFQNSTDQDYDKELYENIQPFLDIFDHWIQKTDIEIRVAYKEETGRDFDEMFSRDYPDYSMNQEKKEEILNYHRRALCYNEIWSHFSNNLFNDDDQIYFSLFSSSDLQTLTKLLKYAHEAYVKLEVM